MGSGREDEVCNLTAEETKAMVHAGCQKTDCLNDCIQSVMAAEMIMICVCAVVEC